MRDSVNPFTVLLLTDLNQTTSILARAREGRNMDFQENPSSNESRDTCTTEKTLSFPSKVLLSIHRSQRNVHTLKRMRGECKISTETPPDGRRGRTGDV